MYVVDSKDINIYSGFYDRNKIYDVNKNTIHITNVNVRKDIKVTFIYDENKYETYNYGTQVVLIDFLCMAIQISHIAMYNKGKDKDVVINIYTLNKKYTYKDTFDTDEFEDVIAIELINAYLKFVDMFGKNHYFFNTVYFLPTYLKKIIKWICVNRDG